MPKRSGTAATTIFWNSICGCSGTGAWTTTTSAFAALLTQMSAAKTEIAPMTAAMPIIVIALPLTPELPRKLVLVCS